MNDAMYDGGNQGGLEVPGQLKRGTRGQSERIRGL